MRRIYRIIVLLKAAIASIEAVEMTTLGPARSYASTERDSVGFAVRSVARYALACKARANKHMAQP